MRFCNKILSNHHIHDERQVAVKMEDENEVVFEDGLVKMFEEKIIFHKLVILSPRRWGRCARGHGIESIPQGGEMLRYFSLHEMADDRVDNSALNSIGESFNAHG